MKNNPMLNEVVLELCYLVHRIRRTGPLAISEHEIESVLSKAASKNVARFIKDGIQIMKRGGMYAYWKKYLESNLLEYVRNPELSPEELKAIHYSMYMLEYCSHGDLEEVVRHCRLILREENEDHERSEDMDYIYEEPVRVRRVLEFLRARDYANEAIDREEFEAFKSSGWEQIVETPALSRKEIQRLLGEHDQSMRMMREEVVKGNEMKFLASVSVIVLNEQNEILLAKGHRGWDMPQGYVEEGESIRQAAVRKVKEATGVDMELDKFCGIFYNVTRGISNHIFTGKPIGGTPEAGGESEDVGCFTMKEAKKKIIWGDFKERIRWALDESSHPFLIELWDE